MRHAKRHRAWALVLVAIPLTGRAQSSPAPAPAVPAAPAVQPKASFSQLRERGRRAYQAQRFDEARDLWKAAAALRPKDPEAVADLALALQHSGLTEDAIRANREAIRLSSPLAGGDRARRIRRAAYYNLGKLKAARELPFTEENDGPSSCVRLESETGCPRPVFACGRTGAIGGRDGRFDYTVARFALEREAAAIVEDGQLIGEFETWLGFGSEPNETRDRSDSELYDVTLQLSSETREPMPGEADVTVSGENGGCAVVYVDACARRLGLSCEWSSWEGGVSAKPRSKAVELTFAPPAPVDSP